MTDIKAMCPDCGEVSLTHKDLDLWVYTGGFRKSYYTFDCPECAQQVKKYADKHTIWLLQKGGVELIEGATHPEHSTPDLPEITPDDLLDFHELLQSSNCDYWLGMTISIFRTHGQQ